MLPKMYHDHLIDLVYHGMQTPSYLTGYVIRLSWNAMGYKGHCFLDFVTCIHIDVLTPRRRRSMFGIYSFCFTFRIFTFSCQSYFFSTTFLRSRYLSLWFSGEAPQRRVLRVVAVPGTTGGRIVISVRLDSASTCFIPLVSAIWRQRILC